MRHTQKKSPSISSFCRQQLESDEILVDCTSKDKEPQIISAPLDYLPENATTKVIKEDNLNACYSYDKQIDISKNCRLCCSRPLRLANIFQRPILKMIKFCSLIELSTEDGMPSRICSSCLESVTKFYAFKKKILKTDMLLRTRLKKNETKIDILDIAFNEAKILDQSSEMELESCSEGITSILENLQMEFISKDENSGICNKDEELMNPVKTKMSKSENLTNKRIIETKIEHKNVKTISDCEQNKGTSISIQSEGITNTQNTTEEIQLCGDNSCNKFVLPSLIPILGQQLMRNEITTTLLEEPPPLVPLKPVKDENATPTCSIKDSPTISIECDKCKEKFESKQLLELHEGKCISVKSLICNICKKEFSERKKLIGHLKGHMISKHYACKICGKQYPSPSTFKIHMRSHTGERPFKCSVCGKGFTRWAGVSSHMQTHDDHRPFKCETCNKSFKILSNLERHKVLHSGILPFCCSYCGKTFSQSDNLQLHIRTYHTNERPYLCSECGKSFVSSTRLKRHMWVHTGFKPFPCTTCSKAYSNSSDLKNHLRSAHGNNENEKQFACNLCDMRFFHPCRLSKHKKTHQRPFACSDCDKTFSSVNHLDKHVVSEHSVEK